jgi:xylulokinase
VPLVAGVDSSTSACKVEVRDLDTGRLVASGRAPHPATTPPRSEHDPAAWWSAFEHAAGQAGLTSSARPAAIAVAGQQHGLVVLDAAGAVIRPAKLWNDTESADDADALVAELGAQQWADACGSVPVASFTITKLRWLRRCEPAAFGRIARMGLPHDWLTHRLTGAWTTDRGDASGTGWWSPAHGTYRTDLLDLVDAAMDWPAMLPEVLGPSDPAGHWPDAGGALVAAGTGDNMAAALGLGLRPGDLALSLGTSGTAFTVTEAPTADPTGAVAGFADATGRFLPLVCTLNATKVTDAVARLLGVGIAELNQLALDADPGAGGLTLVPHFDGERTPNRPHATGSLVGLRSDADRNQLARAAFEGVVCNLLAGADRLPAGDGQVVLVGGGAHSDAYRRIVADLTGRPVLVPEADELVAIGAAVQAAVALTGSTFDDVAEAWNLRGGRTIEPDPTVDAAAIRQRYAEMAGP